MVDSTIQTGTVTLTDIGKIITECYKQSLEQTGVGRITDTITVAESTLLAFSNAAQDIVLVLKEVGSAASNLGTGMKRIQQVVQAAGQIKVQGSGQVTASATNIGKPTTTTSAKPNAMDANPSSTQNTQTSVNAADEALKKIDAAFKDHFAKIMSHAESFSSGMRNVFKTMVAEIIKLLAQKWFDDKVLDPIRKWWDKVNRKKSDSKAGADSKGVQSGNAAATKSGNNKPTEGSQQSVPKQSEQTTDKLKKDNKDYSEVVKQTLKNIDTSFNDHFAKIISGAESFSSGMRNIFKSMVGEIIKTLAKIWFEQKVLPAVTKLFSGVIGGGGASGSTNNAWSLNNGTKLDPNFGFSGSVLMPALQTRAVGGLTSGWAIVGEEGPELVNFSQPGRVYTAQDTQQILNGKTSQTNEVNFYITTPDANSFRKSQGQIYADVNRAIASGRRNM